MELIDDLDLFSNNLFEIKGRKTNAMLEAISQGLEGVIASNFNEALDNVRA